ncbi:caffeic acid 3-O-methyltransferase-like [Coffea eugenioides]|uniref:caffeic acid 3-O-methyltransferase-like n=1 Tax=Coffea eugenioides TaxID=49369 RepID=UPI000F606AC5|nr:caffeic acid 3-O-methyltransferase-like [Coffea eugenioides]
MGTESPPDQTGALRTRLNLKQSHKSDILVEAFTAAIELNLFEIIAKSGRPNAHLSSAQTEFRPEFAMISNKFAMISAMLDRLLQLLSSYSILKCTLVSTENEHTTKLYGLTPMCEFLIPDSNGMSFAPAVLLSKEKAIINCGNSLKDAILKGGTPFHKANGLYLFEYIGNSRGLNEVFNGIMVSHTCVFVGSVLEKYK